MKPEIPGESFRTCTFCRLCYHCLKVKIMKYETNENKTSVPCCFALDPHLHSFCLSLSVRGGCLFEKEEENGITHLLEHMVFRNIKKKYEYKLYEILNENCLNFNAATYKEFVYFYICGIPESFDLAADILLSVLDEISISKKEFDAEKQRIKSEIRESSDRTSLAYFADSFVWKDTPLKNTITGSCGSLDKISLKKLNTYKQRLFTRENLYFVLSGNAGETGPENFRKKLEHRVIPSAVLRNQNTAPVPADFGSRSGELHIKKADFCRASLAFDVDNSRYPVGVRDILYSLLFQGETALIFTEISEDNPIVYSLDNTFEQFDNISVIRLEYLVSRRNIKASLQGVKRAIDKLKHGEFHFEGTLNWILGTREMLRDNAEELNWAIAYDNHILAGAPIDYGKPKLGRYENIRKEDIIRAAEEIFVPRNLSISFKGDPNAIRNAVGDTPADLFA